MKSTTFAATGVPPGPKSCAALSRSAIVSSCVVSIDAVSAGTVTDTTWQRGDQPVVPRATPKMSFVSLVSPSPSRSMPRTGSERTPPPSRLSS